MRVSKTGAGSWDETHKDLDKLAGLPQEDLKTVPTAEIQRVLVDLSFRLSELEAECERLRQSQAELEEVHRQYMDLFDFAPIGYFNLDSRCIILSMNITGSDMLNIPRGKLVSTPFYALIDPAEQPLFTSYLGEVARTGSRLSTELRVRRSEGTTFHAQLETVPLYEKGKLTYRISLADITERKKVELALKESEQKYRDLTDMLPEIVFETDMRGNVVYMNRKAVDYFGLTMEEIAAGFDIFNLVHPEQRNIARARFVMILDKGDIGGYEYTLVKKDGTPFPAIVHSARVTHDSQPWGLRGIVIDISERKRVEHALAESEKRFRTTLDSMLEGCLLVDRSWRYIYANDAVDEQGRYKKEDLVGHTMMEVFPDIEKTELFARFKEAMEKQVAHTVETEFVYPDGAKRWFEIRVEPVPEGILILYANIDKRKQAEQHLWRSIERVERLHGIGKIVKLQPIGMLMIEHRLIDRVLPLLSQEQQRMAQTTTLDPELMEEFVDFFRTYADKTHHGKEENILFKDMEGKSLLSEHREMMAELVQEHIAGRRLTTDLAEATERWASGDRDALKQAITVAGELVKFYRAHIEKEDNLFFPPSMAYFSASEQDDMLLEFVEFDRGLVHEVYTRKVQVLESPPLK
ncbi:MAG: PAS domain S-box protein [Chloroflexi bacterium]|nr:PAS domain S-box protein [Chloroflexota bacterium]